MKDLFDMMSGTSTGSMLASAMSVHKKGEENEPFFWASEMIDFYQDNAPNIFKKNYLGAVTQFLIYTMLLCFFGGLFFAYGYLRYANPNVLKAQREMHEFLLQTKLEMTKEN